MAPADRAFLAILAIALLLRFALVPLAGVYHPDELFQYLEQAHRLAFGQGIVPWEYRYGMRSWLLPLTLVPPMTLGHWLAPSSLAYLLLPRAFAAAGSLSLVWSAWALGRRQSTQHGLIAATIAAVWAEFVFFAPHIMSETASIDLIMPALVLITGRTSPRRIAAAGLLLGLAVIVRMQHAPAVAALVVLALWSKPKAWPALLAGGVIALAVGALVDLAMGQPPYGWTIEYVRQNIVHNRAARFGVDPALTYVVAIDATLGWWTLPMLALAAVGARRCPILLRVALVNLIVHMAIGHKEYRFILLTTTGLALLAAIGTGDAVAAVQRRWPGVSALAPWLALLGWSSASIALAADGRAGRYAMPDTGAPALYAALRGDPGLCGLGTYDVSFASSGGYTYLHRDVTIFSEARDDLRQLRADTSGYNRLVGPANLAAPPGFARQTCLATGLCIFTRPGPCQKIDSPAEINRLLIRVDN